MICVILGNLYFPLINNELPSFALAILILCWYLFIYLFNRDFHPVPMALANSVTHSSQWPFLSLEQEYLLSFVPPTGGCGHLPPLQEQPIPRINVLTLVTGCSLQSVSQVA